ncbi:MAG: hypothetical protein Q8N44_09075 [Rubrivivax sp.]|nr:hypothetical protein [Rubrivivax sp.]MDP3083825.1 hypothetical protein [Rubrivivax sp.]
MKLSRLWQPGHPLFWQMVVFNLLSSGCAWALRSLPLNGAGQALFVALALGNVAFGLLAAYKLMQPADTAS